MTGRGQLLPRADAARKAGWRGCTPHGPNGRTMFSFEIYGPRRQADDRRPRRQLRHRAADASIACCRRWARPRPRRGNIRCRIAPWPTNSRISSPRSRRRAPACGDIADAPRQSRRSSQAVYEQAAIMIIARSPLRITPRRRRHRSAVLLPRARRLPDRGRDRQIRLRHA